MNRRPGPDDPAALARGIAWGLVLSIPLWALGYLGASWLLAR